MQLSVMALLIRSSKDKDLEPPKHHIPGLLEADETGNCFGPGILAL